MINRYKFDELNSSFSVNIIISYTSGIELNTHVTVCVE